MSRGFLPQFASGIMAAWTAGGWVRAKMYQSGLLRQRRLDGKVISIGNITWGGTGKTPFTIWLAGRLQAAGVRVSVLTRGYGRTSRASVKLLPPGALPKDALHDGDEVQLYLRHLKVPIGIAACRSEAGRAVEKQFPVDAHLLDDGFQHLALGRDLDLVLVDAVNPWGSRPGFPRLLREGLGALRRAHAILLTRCELAENDASALQELMQKLNPDAPCFTTRTRLLGFVDCQGKIVAPEEFRARRVAAFCGLGNPRNFFQMLSQANVSVVANKIFPDHHRYTRRDRVILETLTQEHRADCLVTTEKDLVNWPEEASFAVPLYWASIEPVVEQEERFLSWMGEQLGWSGRFSQAASVAAKS